MSPFPFRNPVSSDDSSDEWKPPSYATLSSKQSDKEWTPPSYATLSEKSKPKSDWVKSTISALSPAKRIHPGGERPNAGIGVKDESIRPLEEGEIEDPNPRIARANRLVDPGSAEEKPKKEEKGIFSKAVDAASQFLKDHPTIRRKGQEFLTGTSPEHEQYLKEQGISGVAGPGIMPIPGLDKAVDYISQKVTGSEGNVRLAAGAVTKAIGGLLEGGFDPRTAGIKQPEAVVNKALEPDVHQSGYFKSTPQQDAVAIAQTRDGMPRTPANISAETGIPKASIRRTMSELKKREASPEDIKNFTKSVEEAKTPQEAGTKPSESSKSEVLEQPTQASQPVTAIPEPPIKKQFINPFEKKSDVLPTRSPNLSAEFQPPIEEIPKKPVVNTEQQLYDLARKKQGMGLDRPEEEIAKQKPTAKFAFDWPEAGGKQYNIEDPGNTTGFHRSTVGEARLKELGIDVPETPKEPPVRKSGQQLREEALAAKAHKTSEESNIQRNAPFGEGSIMPSQSLPTELRDSAENWKPPGYAKLSEQKDLRNIKGQIPHGNWLDVQDLKSLSKAHGELKGEASDFSSKPEIDALKNSIEKHGVIQPIELTVSGDGNLRLSEGRHRTAALSELNFKDAPVRITNEAGTPLSYQEAEQAISKFKSGEIAENQAEPEEHQGFWKGERGSVNIKAGPRKPDEPTSGPHGPVLDKLFRAMNDAKGKVDEQASIYKRERARRFAAFSGVKDEGASGAAQSLGKLKGEFDKVNPGETLGLNQQDSDSLFTAIKKANITSGEKAHGYTALFKLMNGESVPVRSELAILDDVFGNGFANKIVELHGGIGMVGIKVGKTLNTMKSMQNALSLAAPLRHGVGMIARKEFYPAFADMFKFFGNKETYDAAMQAIEEHPNYIPARENGLFIAKPGSLNNSEEEFLNSYAGAIPGVRNVVGASQRAYTGFLNKLRFDVYNSMSKTAESLGFKMLDGEESTKEGEAITRYINTSTGREDLPGGLNKITNELNMLLWSPRMIASRITMLTDPKLYTDLPKGMRLDGLKSLLGIAALGTVIDTIGTYAGAKISTNILSSDAAKNRIGVHVIDPWGGFQQYVVAAARFLAGKTDSPQPTSRLEIAGRFLANKESPGASLVHSILTAKKSDKRAGDPTTSLDYTDQYGNKTSASSEVLKRFTPIMLQDLQDLVKSEPDFSSNIGLDAVMMGASAAGMAQEYKQKSSNSFRALKP